MRLTRSEEARRESYGKVNPQAYDLIVRARQNLRLSSQDGLREARKFIDRAIAIDPDFAGSHALLSLVLSIEYANRWADGGADRLDAAMQEARRAVELDPDDPQGHHALSMALLWKKRLDEAEKAAERAIELDPNLPFGFIELGNIQDYKANYETAVGHFAHAMRLDPYFYLALHLQGRALFGLGRFDEAEEAFENRLRHTPNSDMSRFYLAALYGRIGRHDDARRLWREVKEINPTFSVDHLRRTLPYREPSWFEKFTDGLREAGIEP